MDTLLPRDRQEAGCARPMIGRKRQQLAEDLEVNRLDQVVIAARGARPLPVLFLSPARERHQAGLPELGTCSEPPGDLRSVHARHTNVKDDHLRLEIRVQCEGRWAIMGHSPSMCGAGLQTPPTPFRGPGRTVGLPRGLGLETFGRPSGKVGRACHNQRWHRLAAFSFMPATPVRLARPIIMWDSFPRHPPYPTPSSMTPELSRFYMSNMLPNATFSGFFAVDKNTIFVISR